MLELRPNCECCDKDLPPESLEASCAASSAPIARPAPTPAFGICPNCGGELVRRPVRPAGKLVNNPASTKRVLKAEGCAPVKAA
jgi:hypothetical protein